MRRTARPQHCCCIAMNCSDRRQQLSLTKERKSQIVVAIVDYLGLVAEYAVDVVDVCRILDDDDSFVAVLYCVLLLHDALKELLIWFLLWFREKYKFKNFYYKTEITYRK